MSLTEAVSHPLIVLSGLFGAVSYLFNLPVIDPIAHAIWANAGMVLQIATYLQLGGVGSELPAGTLKALIAGAAIVMAVKLLWGLLNRVTTRFQSNE